MPKQEDTAALNFENSSAATALNRKSSAPAPPYSSGMSRPSRPCLPASSQTARSIDLAVMKSSARGFRLRSTNSRTDARKASWSGPYTLRGMGYLRVTKRLLSLRQVGHAVNHDERHVDHRRHGGRDGPPGPGDRAAAHRRRGRRLRGQVAAIVSDFARWHAEHFRTARIVQYEFPHLSPEHRDQVLAQRKQIDAVVRQVLTAGVRSGDFEVPDVAGTTLALLSMCIDVARWYEPGIRRTPEAIGTAYGQLAQRLVRP